MFFSRSLERPRRSQTAMASDSSAACSDSEASTSHMNRKSVPNLDKRDLQRAVAHLQETLQHRMGRESGHSEVKAVVHRGPEAKTLDGQSIKQYESIKLNQYHLGPYETIKPSRLKRKGSGDNLDTNKPPIMGPKPNIQQQQASSTSAVATADKSAVSQQPRRDSFEGHEEAVRTIVEAVQESRKQQQQQQQQQQQSGSTTKRTTSGNGDN